MEGCREAYLLRVNGQPLVASQGKSWKVKQGLLPGIAKIPAKAAFRPGSCCYVPMAAEESSVDRPNEVVVSSQAQTSTLIAACFRRLRAPTPKSNFLSPHLLLGERFIDE
jgi:hypothetical protein